MKKLLSAVLALLMVFSLAACGSTEAPAAEPQAPSNTETSNTETSASRLCNLRFRDHLG